MSLGNRVDKLERDSGDGEPSFIYVLWGESEDIPDDAIITLSSGVMMTYAEVKRRYPDMEHYELEWSEDDEMILTKRED